jgi:hypothetical protein
MQQPSASFETRAAKSPSTAALAEDIACARGRLLPMKDQLTDQENEIMYKVGHSAGGPC